MRFAINARHAHPKEPAQSLYTQQLIQGIARELSAPDALSIYGCHPENREHADCPSVILRGTRFPVRRQALGLLWEQTLLPRQILRERIDVFHSPFFFLPRLRDTRTVVTIHDLAFERNPEHFSFRSLAYFRLFARRSAREADAVITVSEAVRQDVMEYYGVPAQRVHVIPEALNPAFAAAAQRAHATRAQSPSHGPSSSDKPYLLYVGVLHRRKNLLRLLEAFARLPDQFSDLQLRMVGRPSFGAQEVFEAVEQLKLRDRVHFTSGLDFDTLFQTYARARACVIPSYSEGFGFPALEALAARIPIVAAQGGSLPEILGPCATFFAPLSSQDLAVKIEQALTDPLPEAERAPLYERQLAAFDWAKTCQATLALYRSL